MAGIPSASDTHVGVGAGVGADGIGVEVIVLGACTEGLLVVCVCICACACACATTSQFTGIATGAAVLVVTAMDSVSPTTVVSVDCASGGGVTDNP